MTSRALHASLFVFGCAFAGLACQLVSGASSLDIVDEAGNVSQDGSVTNGSTDGASTDARDGATTDAASDSPDAAFTACVVPEGGTYTSCVPGLAAGPPSCIEFCAMDRKCCAEDCQPFVTDTSVRNAELVGDTKEMCVDPLSGGSPMGYTSCSNSPIPGATKFFKCCCR